MPPPDEASAASAALGVPWLDPGAEAEGLAAALRAAFERLLAAPLDEREIPAFEREIAERLGAGDAVAVSSGSDALLAALTALGVGPEDEVITCALGGFAAASAAVRLGARPIFVDIDPATLTLDPALVAAAVGDRTRAVVPVHAFGQPADMGLLGAVASAFSIPLVEDARGAAFAVDGEGRKVGAAGAFGCFSFGPTASPSTLGEAGLVTCDDPERGALVRMLRGEAGEGARTVIGANLRMDPLHAAILRAKLPSVPAWLEARRAHAALYDLLFFESDLAPRALALLRRAPGHAHLRYVVRVPGAGAPALAAHLVERGIGCALPHLLAAAEQPCFEGLATEPFPEAARAARELLALPMHAGLEVGQIERVVGAIEEHLDA
jgi:dTDP-4-amino-4,6-dideoxygalactose transaminase